ncbi:MAG: PIN domain-containing protein [Methylococcaceae bacterium]|nr:PIN domain-containing protein [Methylococcaceae bacterium]
MPTLIVLDTNILVSAMIGTGYSHQALAACFKAQAVPLIGANLLAEYEAILYRPERISILS